MSLVTKNDLYSLLSTGVLIANKIDMRGTKREVVTQEAGIAFAAAYNLDYFETSAVSIESFVSVWISL